MNDFVFNTMINFQFFCNNVFKQKNIDKLVPNGMTHREWSDKKAAILNEEIESTSHYLEQEASNRMKDLPAADREEIERRFQDTIARAMSDYKEKIYDYYR